MSTNHEHDDNHNTSPSIPDDTISRKISGTNDGARLTIVDITPDLAEKWLERNRQNRKVREDRVDRYADQMRDGEWMVSPDAIAFDYNGRLINGQHRLKAITQLEEGESAQCLVAMGLQPSAFKIADVGVKRTGADVLRIEGFKNPQELAAASRLLAMWKQDRLEEAGQYENVRNSVIVEVATRCNQNDGRLMKAIEMCSNDKQDLIGLVPRSMMAAMYFAYKPTFPDRAEYFYNGLVGKNFPAVDWAEEYDVEGAKNPIQQFRKKMHRSYDNYNRERILGFLIKAMNYYCLEKPQKRLRYRASDNFPTIAADMVPELADEPSLDLDLR